MIGYKNPKTILKQSIDLKHHKKAAYDYYSTLDPAFYKNIITILELEYFYMIARPIIVDHFIENYDEDCIELELLEYDLCHAEKCAIVIDALRKCNHKEFVNMYNRRYINIKNKINRISLKINNILGEMYGNV